ncbi:apoptosis regulator BAX-like [Pecten maximus]|uniref:apoptosis regulator BAX-like n=1 Tax=Pecten maximus TaxID=6579 RepID=UPI001457EECC|nr:apoptosis regulator BAX-like [Pecten maximus]
MNTEGEGDSGQQSDDAHDGSVVHQRRRHRSFTEKRRNSMNLTPLVMPGNNTSSFGAFNFPSRFGKKEDIKEESKELFERFVYDEISREHLHLPDDLETLSGISTPQGYKNPTWAKYGRELRVMADEFAETKERQRIKKRAGNVDMNSATYESFSDMLSELFFSGGMSSAITRERLVVLFFFCSDIVIRSLKAKATDLFRKFIEWSTQFITSKVAEWIERLGGWGTVLRTSGRLFTNLLMISAVCIVAFAVGKVIIRRNTG